MKQKRREGDFVRVTIKDGVYGIARVLDKGSASMAFYDCIGASPPELPEELEHVGILFIVPVAHWAVTSGRWSVVGYAPLEERLLNRPPYCMVNILTGEPMTTYTGSNLAPSTYEECKDLERAMVWEPEHIEERLLDHLDGRENRFQRLYRLKPG